MSDLVFYICCTATFFSKKIMNPPNLNTGKYSPHVVIKGNEEHFESHFI